MHPAQKRVEKALCALDMAYWVNQWVWTFDPREDPALMPFDLWPKQTEFLAWLAHLEETRQSGLAEKSRGCGLTWLCAAYATHQWLFREGDATGFGSRKLDLVDKLGDPDSILEKVRILVRNLPLWMRPKGYDEPNDAQLGKIVNPENGSIISGEGGDNIGRGGRKRRYFVDEAAHLVHPKLVDAALQENTNTRIDLSTPKGPGNPFAQRRYSLPAERVFTFHYRDDPRKTPEWIAEKKADTDPVTWAQEYEIDYTASIEGICCPAAWVRAAVGVVLPSVSETYPLEAGLDLADGGSARSVLVTRQGPRVAGVNAWPEKGATEAAWLAAREAERQGVRSLAFDAIGVGSQVAHTWKTASVPPKFAWRAVKWGEPATERRMPSGKTARETFRNLRAELWWSIRVRLEKTFEWLQWTRGEEGGYEHPADEMISLPNDPQLIAELSLPLYYNTTDGKIGLESKDDMSKRGVKSPDYGDALAYSFAPEPEANIIIRKPVPANRGFA